MEQAVRRSVWDILQSPGLTAVRLEGPWWLAAGAGAGSYAACYLGFALRFPDSGISFLWPPTAVLISALLLSKPRLWWAPIAGAFCAHALAHAQDGLRPGTWVVQFAANAIQAGLTADLVRRYSGNGLALNTLRGVAVFVGAAIVAPVVASLVAAAVYVNAGWASDYWWAWRARTLSGIITTLTIVPPIAVLWRMRTPNALRMDRRHLAEFGVMLLCLLAVAGTAVFMQRTNHYGLSLALYAPAPFLLWAAVRFGSGGLSFGLLAAAVVTILGALRGHTPFLGETPADTVLGVQMFMGITAVPLMLLAGLIEEHRDEHQRLLESEQQKSALLRAVPDLMFVQGRDGTYLDYSARRTGDLLVAPSDFLGLRMRDVLPADLVPQFEQAFEQAGDEGPQVIEYALPVDGQVRHYEARVVGLDEMRVLSIVRDITDRRRAEDSLRLAQIEVTRLERLTALGELAATIAHEVNQPLCAIVSNANVCLRWVDEPEPHMPDLRDALKDVVQDGLRASEVIRRTREFFAGKAGVRQPTNINDAIIEIAEMCRRRVERADVSLELDLDPNLPEAEADPIQVQQVVLNLMLNALEAMRAVTTQPRVLRVESRRGRRCALIAVSDTGEGVHKDDLRRLFDLSYTTKAAGMGIGLAFSRSIVRAHGGRLWATRNTDRGATFRFTLPTVA